MLKKGCQEVHLKSSFMICFAHLIVQYMFKIAINLIVRWTAVFVGFVSVVLSDR